MEAWDEVLLFIGKERQMGEVFKNPQFLAYIDKLQKFLIDTGIVGKSNSLTDIVKTVYRELLSGEEKDFKIPVSPEGVAQCLITYQNSHRPQDLWHFVTPDYKKAVIWAQLKSGDNKYMTKLKEEVDRFIAENPPPFILEHEWFGLTYLNVVWQKKMVNGMLESFLGSFIVVFVMMTVLFRSALWGAICMIPLSTTICFIYGIIGFIGKDYDMPVAILSSMALGLAVDYAIHFLSRSRSFCEQYGSWQRATDHVFGEPARAISRNIIVVGVGFLPLIVAPLTPYQTVGVFIAAILLLAGLASLIVLPSLMRLLEKPLFPKSATLSLLCNCTSCIIAASASVIFVAINVYQFFKVGWTILTWFSIAAIIILAVMCFILGRRDECSTDSFYERKKGGHEKW